MFTNCRLLTILILICSCGFAQISDTSRWKFIRAERELRELQAKTFHSRNEAERIEGNKEFIAVWDRIAVNPEIMRYEFDSLPDISVLSPRDNKFKLITWNLHRNDGTHHYFGYLLVNNSKRVKKGFLKHETIEEFNHFKLMDKSALVKSPETYVGTPEKWFGMLYLQVVECDDYYTLIGWDGNDKLTQRKFVDVLYFKSNGEPVFGKDVFKFPRKNPRRLMFEWSQEVSMSLKYVESEKRIVYSHLASKQEGSVLDGQFQYYGPDGSFDALEMHKGRWVTVEDVDARNDKSPNDRVKKPKPNEKIMPKQRAK